MVLVALQLSVARIVPATGIQKSTAEGIESCPHNHFVAGPHCRVRSPLRRDISQGGRCPAIGAWICTSPPVFEKKPLKSIPPHTIISVFVHTAL